MSPAERPAPGVPRPYHFPATYEHALANGLTVVTVPLHRLPAVSILYTADAGAERDTADGAGLAELVARSLTEGTQRRDAQAVAVAAESRGGELLSGANWTHAECGTTVMRERAADTMAMIAEVVREPRFPTDGVERLREERLADLLQQRAEPRGLADDLFVEQCFAAGERYARPAGGSSASVGQCSADEVRAFHRAHYVPRGSLLIVSGDIAPDAATKLAEEHFGGWEGAAGSAPLGRDVGARSGGMVAVGHRADAPQSEIRIGHASIPRTHPDFHAVVVMNAILGGLFNSRINLNLREAHGYTYGAFSAFDWRRRGSVFEVSTAVKSDVTAPAVQEVLGEIRRIREEPVRADELSLATDYLTGVFPLRYETTAAIADAIAFRVHYGHGPGYYDEYRARIAAVAIDDVLRVAQLHLDPARMHVAVVGDADVIAAPLAALGVGEVQRVELPA